MARPSIVERAWQVAVGAVALLAWEGGAHAGWIDARLVSFPSAILARTARDVLGGALLSHAAATLVETGLGFVAGAVTGLACGVLLVHFRMVRLVLLPYLMAIYSIPRPALAPLFVLWFGVGLLSKLVLVVTLVYFVFVLHVVAGAQAIDPRHLDWLRTLGASRLQIMRRVVLPHLLPWLFAATKLGLALALVGAVVGEFISARMGLGFLMMQAAENLDRVGVLSGIFLLSAIVMAIVLPMDAVERRLFRWRTDLRV